MYEMPSLEKQKSQSGQALVEYVLLLVVAVALILGLAHQFYKPFGNWVQNQMGPYLECLLDVGELPAIGGEMSGECSNSYKPMRSGGPNHGQSGSPNLKDPNGKPTKNKTGSKGSSDETSSSASNSGGAGGGRQNQGFKIGGHRGADGAPGDSGGQVMTEKLPESKYFKFRSSGSSSIRLQQPLATGLGNLPAEKQNLKRKENASFKAGTIDQSGDGTGKPQRLVITPPERKVAAEEPDVPWSFGRFVKFALILLIVVAIVLFLGGQVAQISKSMEK